MVSRSTEHGGERFCSAVSAPTEFHRATRGNGTVKPGSCRRTTGPRLVGGRQWYYDASRGHVILFGGREGVGRGGTSRGDTWEWDGKVWKELRSDDGPSGRDHHAMVYDRARGSVVVFGGWDGEAVVGDTWEWNGKWQRVGRNGPPARAAHAMAYDGKRGVAVLFGGRALEMFFDDTWLWDGKEWSQVDAHGPPKRAFHGMTYLPESQNTVLFGGRVASDFAQHPPASPAHRVQLQVLGRPELQRVRPNGRSPG